MREVIREVIREAIREVIREVIKEVIRQALNLDIGTLMPIRRTWMGRGTQLGRHLGTQLGCQSDVLGWAEALEELRVEQLTISLRDQLLEGLRLAVLVEKLAHLWGREDAVVSTCMQGRGARREVGAPPSR